MKVGRITEDFRELKQKLADVSGEQWAAIPETGDYSLKYKKIRIMELDGLLLHVLRKQLEK